MSGADRSATTVTEDELLGGGRFTVTRFAVGPRVRGCHQRAAGKREGSRPVWFYGLIDKSWACVMFRDGQEVAQVRQSGPRRLWGEVAACWKHRNSSHRTSSGTSSFSP